MSHPSSNTDRQAQIYAGLGTAIIVAIVVLLLIFTRMRLEAAEVAPADKGEIMLAEEEFIDVVEMPSAPNLVGTEQATAHAEEMAQAQPTPASGTDMDNAGPAAATPNVVSSQEESPVKVSETEQKPGPSAEELRREEEQRQANNEVTNAFSNSKGQHNTAHGNKDEGNAGKPTSTNAQGSYTGRGTGQAGGGWAIPSYGSVRSTVTGSIKMKLTIDRNGKVTDLVIIGGDAPAASNQKARRACEIEVRSRTFTRTNPDDAPETSTAYVTYIFQ